MKCLQKMIKQDLESANAFWICGALRGDAGCWRRNRNDRAFLAPWCGCRANVDNEMIRFESDLTAVLETRNDYD